MLLLLFFWGAGRWARAGLIAYVLAMAFTLVYAGEHYVADILIGWLYAAAVVAGVAWARRRRAHHRHSQRHLGAHQYGPEGTRCPPWRVPDVDSERGGREYCAGVRVWGSFNVGATRPRHRVGVPSTRSGTSRRTEARPSGGRNAHGEA